MAEVFESAKARNEGRQVIVYVCYVVGDGGINIRTQPNSGPESKVAFTVPSGTALNYFEKVRGQSINNNNCWGHSVEGHYFWLGGTDSPFC